MPVPIFNFDKPQLGLPRHPVPVRFVCLAANWSPGLLATLISGDPRLSPQPLLTAHEFISESDYVGEVHPGFYQQLCGQSNTTPEALVLLPANHFVWSDDLVRAHSDLIDLTQGRENAWATGTSGIQWTPALGDCFPIVDGCPNLEHLVARESLTINRIQLKGDIWTIDFDGVESNFRNSIGMRYIHNLLTHANREISVVELDREINPAPPDFLGGDSNELLAEDADDTDRDGDYLKYDSVIDQKAVTEIKIKIEKINEQIEDQRERGNHEKVESLTEERDRILEYVSKATKLGGTRSRSYNTDAEKIRKAVSKAIRLSINAIGISHPALGKHLTEHVKTGTNCNYNPSPQINWLG